MNYFEVISKIVNTAKSHILVKEAVNDDIYEHLNSGDHQYPCVVLSVQSINDTDEYQTLNGTLFYVDRMMNDQQNKEQIQSMGISVLRQIFRKVQDENAGLDLQSNTYTIFDEQFSDICAGAYGSFALGYPANEDCNSDGVFPDDFDYLTFTAVEDSGISMTNYGGNAPYIEYTTDGYTWQEWNYGNIALSAGEWVKMRGNNPNGLSSSESKYCSFTMSGKIKASGSLLSLLYMNSNYTPSVPNYCFWKLFYYCDSLITAPYIKTNTIGNFGMSQLYYECTNLNYAKVVCSQIGYSASYYFMHNAGNDVEGEKVLVKKDGFEFPAVSRIPEGWTIINE